MKYISTIIAVILLNLASTLTYAGDYDFEPGMWESTTTVEITGVPPEMAAMMQVPPQTRQDCVKENDLVFPSDTNCKYEKQRVSARKLLVNITCTTPHGVSKGNGEANFNRKTASGWFEMEMPQGPAGTMKMKSIFHARYVGACQ